MPGANEAQREAWAPGRTRRVAAQPIGKERHSLSSHRWTRTADVFMLLKRPAPETCQVSEMEAFVDLQVADGDLAGFGSWWRLFGCEVETDARSSNGEAEAACNYRPMSGTAT